MEFVLTQHEWVPSTVKSGLAPAAVNSGIQKKGGGRVISDISSQRGVSR
jgi:hypothetical protein